MTVCVCSDRRQLPNLTYYQCTACSDRRDCRLRTGNGSRSGWVFFVVYAYYMPYLYIERKIEIKYSESNNNKRNSPRIINFGRPFRAAAVSTHSTMTIWKPFWLAHPAHTHTHTHSHTHTHTHTHSRTHSHTHNRSLWTNSRRYRFVYTRIHTR